MTKKKKEVKIDSVKVARIIGLKKDYIKNTFNGRYFVGRCNMMQAQLIDGGKIIESIDGCLKSRDLLMAEYGLMRMQAIDSFRLAHFAKKELSEKYSVKETDLAATEARYYEGKIIDEEENEKFRIQEKAEFINQPEN